MAKEKINGINERDLKCPKCKRILGGNFLYCDLCYDYIASETYAEKLNVLAKVKEIKSKMISITRNENGTKIKKFILILIMFGAMVADCVDQCMMVIWKTL